MKRAVIVGCGNIAHVHAAVIKDLSEAELVGAADIVYAKARSFAQKFNAKPYTSLEEMLKIEKPDVLHICTPHYLHTPMAEYALARGINVFMEKPPVISYEQLAQLKKAVENSEAKLGLCYQNRYNPSFLEAKRFLESDKAGAVKGARGLVTWNRGSDYYTNSSWRGRLKTEGGGVLINQSVHTLDLLCELLGEPEWTDASMANHHLKGVIEVEDTMEAYVSFGGRIACFYATNAYRADVPPIIEICAEKATVRIEDPDVTIFYSDGNVERPQLATPDRLGKSYWGSGHTACIGDFYATLEQGREFALELPRLERSIRLMLGVYESAREHHIVNI